MFMAQTSLFGHADHTAIGL